MSDKTAALAVGLLFGLGIGGCNGHRGVINEAINAGVARYELVSPSSSETRFVWVKPEVVTNVVQPPRGIMMTPATNMALPDMMTGTRAGF